jgi:hypothetical protein
MLVSSPSKVPMLKGDVNAANLRGFGAVICPDSKAFAAYLDTFDAPNKKTTSDLENMRRFGCSYFPPGTAMVSEGGDPNGSLVAVKVNLSDNRTVVGVTFSNWIVQNEQQREKAIQQPLTEKQTTQSEPQTAPTVYQVENPAPPAQTPSIPEIDRQAITLWNQKRYADAIPLFNQACSGGKTDSCYRLGLMYDFGQGVTQDSSRAAAFYSKSCNAGIGAACYHLSMLQQYQPGGAVCNSVAVTRNLSRSCDTGIATSCSIVGYSYIHGCGVAKDTEKGRQLLSKGCSLGDHNACDGIK